MSIELIRDRLTRARTRKLTDEQIVDEAIALARELNIASRRAMTIRERRDSGRMRKLVGDPVGKMFTVAMADRVFRSASNRKKASQFRQLLRQYGTPESTGMGDRLLLHAGSMVSWLAPGLVMPAVLGKMRSESRRVVLRERRRFLTRYLESRKSAGYRVNLNHLGEAVLGEEEAARRLDTVVGLLAQPEIDYLSVKLSAIHSQIDLLGYEESLEEVCNRLRRIYREAKRHPVHLESGRIARKFVNLDMEEYQDVQLTLDAFRTVLDEPEFQDLEAGVVLQAYLPDSFKLQRDLTEWARARRANGGSAVKLRIVKGANHAMEQIEAEMEGWPLAPYSTKGDTDANFKRMVAYGCRKENADAVRIGIGSHNLFDISYALICREMNGVDSLVEFEMLEGMANHQARALNAAGAGLVLYAPIVRNEDFHNALAYLVRRLDENSTDGNFLKDSFGMRHKSKAWRSQAEAFGESVKNQEKVQSWPNRVAVDDAAHKARVPKASGFKNEPTSDWSVPETREWMKAILTRWQDMPARVIPLGIDSEEIEKMVLVDGFDPSRPDFVPYKVCHGGREDVDKAMRAAVRSQAEWNKRPVVERRRLLERCASELSHSRADLIGATVLDGGKSVTEADAEVSEAIDFARYYANAFDEQNGIQDCEPSGRGVTLVVPPWNFPLAIPAGGIFAALMAGNSVILKPAPETPLVSWRLVQVLWDAGIPRDVLQFFPCADDEAGQRLVTHENVDTVILTGSNATARLFCEWKPEMRLLAETSGKNAIIVTANADRDEAVRALVQSAFSHSGQKCSSASLGILEAEVYDSPAFLRQLRDAVASLKVGPAWDPRCKVTPLIHPPSGKLEQALTKLDEGEEWLLEPRQDRENPRLWSPGIKTGIAPESFMHTEECFGPVLGLMRAKNLKEAVSLQNAVEFGLTAGIQTLDEREVRFWRDQVEAGNLYVNRGISGAIVRRQPFGGWKASRVGPGSKAGGPDYVYSLARIDQLRIPSEIQRSGPNRDTIRFLDHIKSSLRDDDDRQLAQTMCWNYAWAHQRYFSKGHDPTRLKGELNVLRYRPVGKMLYRFGEVDTDTYAVFGAAIAAKTTSVPLAISLAPALADLAKVVGSHAGISVKVETEAELASRLGEISPVPHMLRAPGGASATLHETARVAGIAVEDSTVVANGRLELRHWFDEQVISQTRHRYGNILQRRKERRAG